MPRPGRLSSLRRKAALEFVTLDWVDWFKNRRLLQSIGTIPLAELERAYYR